MKRLVLVRHGESIWNAEARIQGQRCAGLSELGHQQAKVTALALAAAHPDARLVTSDLQRTRETIAPLEAALARPATPDPRLRERSFGDWEGRLRDEVRDLDAERWRRWVAGADVVAEVGGESEEQLGDRVEPVLHELLATTDEDGVTIAVTHGGPVWHGTHRLLGLARGTLGGVGNASVTTYLQWTAAPWGAAPTASADDGQVPVTVVLDRWNEQAHLPPELRSGWRPKASSDAPPAGR